MGTVGVSHTTIIWILPYVRAHASVYTFVILKPVVAKYDVKLIVKNWSLKKKALLGQVKE